MLRFFEFAAQLMESKIRAGELCSQASKDQWAEVLEGRLYGAPFASFFCDQIRQDYDAETGELVLRRSHTRGSSVMESTKNAHDSTVILPAGLRPWPRSASRKAPTDWSGSS